MRGEKIALEDCEQCTSYFHDGFTCIWKMPKKKKKRKLEFVDELHLLWFDLQEELLNGCKDLCEKIIKPKLKDYFKEIPKTPFE